SRPKPLFARASWRKKEWRSVCCSFALSRKTRRRDFRAAAHPMRLPKLPHWLLVAAFCFAGVTASAAAQNPPRLGILVQEMERAQSQAIRGLNAGLKQLGYRERSNIFFETRNVKGNRAALQPAAAELLERKVSVIFTTGTSATRAALAATREVPIVFVHPSDPAAAGLLKSAGDTREYRLALFKEIVPELKKILVFYDANNSSSRESYGAIEAAAKKMGLQAQGWGIKSSDELKTALSTVPSEPGTGIFQIADDLFESESDFLFENARAKKLPTMFNEESWAIRGALAAYGPNYLDMGRRAAGLIDRILKGAAPAALPIERATKFDLTLNYRAATFIGFHFAPALLKRADKVIR